MNTNKMFDSIAKLCKEKEEFISTYDCQRCSDKQFQWCFTNKICYDEIEEDVDIDLKD